ncbi:hypothetical protein HKD37_01G002336 [Glycine soja]
MLIISDNTQPPQVSFGLNFGLITLHENPKDFDGAGIFHTAGSITLLVFVESEIRKVLDLFNYVPRRIFAPS